MKKLFQKTLPGQGIPAFSDGSLKAHMTPCITVIMIISCLLTAVAQAGSFSASSHYTKIFSLSILFLCYTGLLCYFKVSGKLKQEDSAVFMMLLLGIFLLCGYAVMLFSFAAFVIIYPYTCSSDFRYITICLIYIAIGIGLGNKYYLPESADSRIPAPYADSITKKTGILKKAVPAIMHIINWGILMILLLCNIIYLFWERW